MLYLPAEIFCHTMFSKFGKKNAEELRQLISLLEKLKRLNSHWRQVIARYEQNVYLLYYQIDCCQLYTHINCSFNLDLCKLADGIHICPWISFTSAYINRKSLINFDIEKMFPQDKVSMTNIYVMKYLCICYVYAVRDFILCSTCVNSRGPLERSYMFFLLCIMVYYNMYLNKGIWSVIAHDELRAFIKQKVNEVQSVMSSSVMGDNKILLYKKNLEQII